MKSFIPEDMRGRTLSNLIVVCVGILLAITLLHLKELWSGLAALLHTVMPFVVGFAIAFLLLPIVNRVEKLFGKVLSRKKPHPKLCRVLATVIAYVVLLALLSGFFAILVPQLITSIKSILQYVMNFFSANSERINELLLNLEFLNIEGEQLVISWENINSRLIEYARVVVQLPLAHCLRLFYFLQAAAAMLPSGLP